MINTRAQLHETSSQTAGPYVHIGLMPEQIGIHVYDRTFGNVLATNDTLGERIRIEGCIIDGTGTPVRDGVVELLQLDAAGLSPGANGFRGWGRSLTDLQTGLFSFDTIKPGRAVGAAPHLSFWIVARGINIGLHTRMYFSDEASANAADPVLRLIDPARQDTLIAPRTDRRDACPLYTFDIHLQGERETVFFDL
jgi:protocatechuate 3,4-dioxygenase alpha subunit